MTMEQYQNTLDDEKVESIVIDLEELSELRSEIDLLEMQAQSLQDKVFSDHSDVDSDFVHYLDEHHGLGAISD